MTYGQTDGVSELDVLVGEKVEGVMERGLGTLFLSFSLKDLVTIIRAS